MKSGTLKRIGAEVDTIVRVRRLDEDVVVNRICEWMDYEFHGVVPLPLEAEPVPEPKPKART